MSFRLFLEESLITVYTGSNAPFTKFDISMFGKRTDPGFAGRGAYTTTSKEQARNWGQYVMSTKVNPSDNFIRINNISELYSNHGMRRMTDDENKLPQDKRVKIFAQIVNDFADKAISKGYEGVEWKLSNGKIQYVLYKPEHYTFEVEEQ